MTPTFDSPRVEGVGAAAGRPGRLRELLIVLMVLVAAFAGGLAVTELRTPVYEATAQLVVTPVSRDDDTLAGLPLLRDLGDPIRTIETAAALLDSQQVADAVARRRARWTLQSVRESVDVAPLAQTNVLVVTARSSDPEEAARLATTYTDTLVATRRSALRQAARQGLDAAQAQLAVSSGTAVQRLEERITDLQLVLASGDPTLAVNQVAAVPDRPVGPSPSLVLALATGAGLGMGLLTVAALRRLRAHPGSRSAEHDDRDLSPAPAASVSAPARPAQTELQPVPVQQPAAPVAPQPATSPSEAGAGGAAPGPAAEAASPGPPAPVKGTSWAGDATSTDGPDGSTEDPHVEPSSELGRAPAVFGPGVRR